MNISKSSSCAEKPPKRQVAFHQAGHAVVQTLVGRGRFKVARVCLDGECGGSWRGRPVLGESTIDRETVLRLYEFGLVTLAGIAAEECEQAQRPPLEEPLVAISDLARWQEQAWDVLQNEAQVRLVTLNVMRKLHAWFAADHIWRAVESLAQELLQHGEVEGQQLHALLANLQPRQSARAG